VQRWIDPNRSKEFVMNVKGFTKWTSGLLLVLTLGACGGGDDFGDTGTGPQPTGTVIGSAGGTVVGPNGASIVIPPGALAANTTIAITQSSAGTPALPSGFTPRGPMFAFTPHGTTFALPVTLTLPFDGTAVPAAMAPAFYKTNAQNQWELVSNATFGPGTLSAQITSFSNGQGGVELTGSPLRLWSLYRTSTWGNLEIPIESGEQTGGEVKVSFLFGPAHSVFEQDNGETPGLAMGEVFSSPSGESFSAYAEAPSRLPEANFELPPVNSGGVSSLRQFQSYVKRAPDATLQLVLSAGFLSAVDFNGLLVSPECNHGPVDEHTVADILARCIPLMTFVAFKVVAFKGPVAPGEQPEFFSTHGIAEMAGFDGKWYFFAKSVAGSGTPLWTDGNWTIVNPLTGSTPLVKLNAPLVINIDLSSIEVCPPDQDAIFCTDKSFTIFSFISAETWNWRARESGAAAYLRDPQRIGGNALQMTGLEATNRPLPLPTGLAPPIACSRGPDPAAGVLQFSAASYSAFEATGTRGSRDILVTRTQGSKGAVSVSFSAGGGTAVSGVDYEMPPVTVLFGDGDTTPRLIPLNVLMANKIAEPSKTVDLTLANPGGCAALGSLSSAVLTLRDDDSDPPTVPSSFRIGGTVTGLAGTGLVLRNLGTNDLSITGNGGFTFTNLIPNGTPYSVTVATQPANPSQICIVVNGSGTVSGADVTNVTVNCATPPPTGGLDPTFGSGGKVTTAFGGDDTAMALQADGKIVMVGGSGTDFLLALDTSFGIGGLVTSDVGAGSNDEARAVAIQTDGKIVVVGNAVVGRTSSNQFNFDFAVARFNVDGSPDTSFGSGGRVTIDFNGQVDRAFAVAIQSDGRVVVVGSAAPASGISTDFGVVRFNSNGTLDTSFGSGGKLTTDVGGAQDIAQNVVVQSNGAILVSGVLSLGSDPTLGHGGLARYDVNGAPDSSFGSAGRLTIPGVSLGDSLAVQSDGRIVIAGSVPVSGTAQFALMRLNASGSPDGSFGSNGLVTTGFTTQADFARAVAIQADGRIVVAGQSSNRSNPDFAVARYAASGALDASFGAGGKMAIDFFGSFDGAESVAIQSDAKVVVGGFARNGTSTGYALVRILP
jgi:uncharacterized delta-60 repeat protein